MKLTDDEFINLLKIKKVESPEKYTNHYYKWHEDENGNALNILMDMILHNDLRGGLPWTRDEIEKVMGTPHLDPNCPHDITFATRDESVVHALFFEDETDRQKLTAWSTN